jgi:glycine/D-amino acid oxidase-like deaminating enzyme/nitrite reductase/ring-hydroxylating ferredoxin subunit
MINRDGARVSLWQDAVDSYETTNSADNTSLYDVIIVGGGITGITTALLLQKAGKQCLVLEAANLCFGTTGGTTAHLNTLLDVPYTTIIKNFGEENAKLVANAAKEAINLVRDNINTYNIECGFSEAEAYLFAQNDNQEKELDDIMEACKTVGLSVDYTEQIPFPIPFNKAMKVKDQAKFNPVFYVHGIAKAFESHGGVIVQNCRVTNVDDNEVVEVETENGKFKTRDLIYATHIPPGVNLLHLRCVPYRSYAMAVTLTNKDYPSDLGYDMVDPYHYYRTQEVNGKTYLIAGGKDHKTAHEENTGYCFMALESEVRKHFDIEEINYKWSSQYYESADGLPYIGHIPGHPQGIFVATGFGGNGMTYSHVTALTLKEMFLNEEKKYADLFNPNRVKPVAGFKNFLSHNADVAKQFIGKWFSGEDLQQVADLAPGEGKIVKYNKNKVALYKDDNGALHAVNPTCVHLKCEVKWNNAERSWDCPCHGARYSYDGTMLNGPASGDLEKIEIKTLVAKDK